MCGLELIGVLVATGFASAEAGLRFLHPACTADPGCFVPKVRYLVYLVRDCQIRCSHVACIDSSARNFSLVIYVFGSFETGRKAAFEIVEVCGVGAVIPNNGTTINKVRVA